MCWDDCACAPDLAYILSLDYLRVASVLKLFDRWTGEERSDGLEKSREEKYCTEDDLWLGVRRYWLFALLVCLELYVM